MEVESLNHAVFLNHRQYVHRL